MVLQSLAGAIAPVLVNDPLDTLGAGFLRFFCAPRIAPLSGPESDLAHHRRSLLLTLRLQR